MKKNVWILICLAIITFWQEGVFALQLQIIDHARIHTSPSSSSPFVDVASTGDTLPVLEKNGEWFKTKYRGNEGWVLSSQVRLISGTGSGSANLFTKQDVSMLPPVPEESSQLTQKWARVTGNNIRILEYLSPESPFLVIARKGDVFPLFHQGDTWCRVVCKDTIGVVRCSELEILDVPPTGSIILKEAKTVLIIVLGASLVIVLIVGLVTYRHISAERKRNIFVKKNALILAKETKMVQYMLTNASAPVEHCFSEIGFNVNVTKDSVTARQNIEHSLPDLILVDWNFEPAILAKLENLLVRLDSSALNIYFLFYNVPDPSSVPQSKVLKNVSFFGPTLSDRDIFAVVTPLITSGEQGAKNVQASVQRCALQGEIAGGNLLEVLQFIEIGSKTGCLMIDIRKNPFGLVYFKNGKIIYAAAAKGQGVQAVYSILNLSSGNFRFIVNKTPKTANLNLSTLSVLMEWTKEKDEAHRS
ncbi:MAG: DUF4388 domain-containing protein [Chitinispirillales bacterium]|jgi:hypothetical protein|nr:DUF4388 domain-containing protein [Chitinispirillales bacterium]